MVNISFRGVFCRIYCDEMFFLRIDFWKKDLVKKGLFLFDDFKLVIYCMLDDIKVREILV